MVAATRVLASSRIKSESSTLKPAPVLLRLYSIVEPPLIGLLTRAISKRGRVRATIQSHAGFGKKFEIVKMRGAALRCSALAGANHLAMSKLAASPRIAI